MASCTYSVPDKEVSGDNLYGAVICNQVYVDYFWNTYGFAGNKDYWDDGFGWEDPCNTDKPLARTFNACYLLTYSANDYSNDSYSSPILNWGRRYVRETLMTCVRCVATAVRSPDPSPGYSWTTASSFT